MMTSTLVETVSINYEDFNESFLTCSTCLCVFDNNEHTPKLLSCSHTVCRDCLERIVEAQVHDTGTIRCPICREIITIPRGGVATFPPSFLVNQLLDLMSRQRRDVIPKCSVHTNKELLFCESCDKVFCTQCSGITHNGRGASEHTVIPFSIAIKRMSEILLYKAHLCIKNLTSAFDNVSGEISKLESSYEKTTDAINRSFQDLKALIDKRRQDCILMVRKIREEKKFILKEQLDLIQSEKEQVQSECDGLQYQVEVRNITKKIIDLNEKLDATSVLSEPRENHFIKYEFKHNNSYKDILNALSVFGRVRVSTTFPALSTAKIGKAITHLSSVVTVNTIDYHGNPRTSGCDPVQVDLRTETGELVDTKLKDKDDGCYEIAYTPPKAGKMKVCISIFNRSIKNSPFSIEVSDHNNPMWAFGSRGTGRDGLLQPVQVVSDESGTVYVLDTGNSRIKCIAPLGDVTHIGPTGLENQGGTGLSMSPEGHLVVVNWRTKQVSTIRADDGELVRQFSAPEFNEPIDVAVNSKGDVIVADNGANKVYIFHQSGRLMTTFGWKGEKEGQFKLISAICIGKCDEILVADHRIQVFSRDGKFSRQIPEQCKGQYGGLTVDPGGSILATRTEKGKSFVQVMNSSGKPMFQIDSHDEKLKRPSGLATTTNHYVVVVDLGNNCIKKYRYR